MNPYSRLFTRHVGFLLLAPDKGGSSGGGEKTVVEQLADANKSVETLTKERDDAKSDLTKEKDEAKKNTDALQGQFDAAAKEAKDAKAELATAKTQVTDLTKERDDFKAAGEKKDKRITNLETLCGVKGINPNAAPPAVDQPADSVASFDQQMKEAKTPAARLAIATAAAKALGPQASA